MNRSEIIKRKATELGFLACGIAKAEKLTGEEQHLNNYLSAGFHGEMDYMARHFDKRLDPTLLVPGAQSVVLVLMNYFPSEIQRGRDVPIVAKYAYGKDYHVVVKEKLKQLFDFINIEVAPVNGRCFTDSAPVLERAWAVRAGLGWIGKNGLLINCSFGSFFFIGELIIDLELEYDQPYLKEHCGRCTRCIQSCPTRSIVQPGRIDARRCISYLTIESKKDLPGDLKQNLSKRIFGCDVCQDVCPWNRFAKPHSIHDFIPESSFLDMDFEAWSHLDQVQFERLFGNSSLKRAGYQKLMQNISNVTNG